MQDSLVISSQCFFIIFSFEVIIALCLQLDRFSNILFVSPLAVPVWPCLHIKISIDKDHTNFKDYNHHF
jgi:hypothetical protein